MLISLVKFHWQVPVGLPSHRWWDASFGGLSRASLICTGCWQTIMLCSVSDVF